MSEDVARADSTPGTVFWRITEAGRDHDVESLIEIEADGSISREIDVAADGTPVRVTRPGEYGQWNDSPYPPIPPGSPQFLEEWGGLGAEISRDEFEATYARADAMLPRHEPLSRRETLGLLIAIVIAVIVALAFLRWLGFIG